ncbi:hypothetical protein MRB53_018099 [Persea americana]|uniref:Uncharacterized protein n=1 Tax=Persea americana TaxID=3435 RepID=A0ACC2M6W9_PERAE|nr:hypothetical protein MRB53_018099 [Persea americana]
MGCREGSRTEWAVRRWALQQAQARKRGEGRRGNGAKRAEREGLRHIEAGRERERKRGGQGKRVGREKQGAGCWAERVNARREGGEKGRRGREERRIERGIARRGEEIAGERGEMEDDGSERIGFGWRFCVWDL